MANLVTIGVSPAIAHWMKFSRFEIAGVNRTADTGFYAAGKSINAARAAATVGAKAVCVAPAGGRTGELFGDLMARESLGNATVRVAGATRICTTLIAPPPHNTTELVEEPPPLTAAEVDRLLEAFAALATSAGAVVAAGTLAPGVEPDFYARVVRNIPSNAQASGCPIVVDAKGPALLSAVTEADRRQIRLIAKPNLQELLHTFPGTTPHAALTALMDLGAWAAVITDGPSRLFLAHDQYVWTLHPPKVEAISPIGSGDTLAGTLATFLMQGMALDQAVTHATAAATANCLTVGPAVFDGATAAKLARHVKIDPPRLLWQVSEL
jgi:tagatose 6-phosphate kinase